MLEVCIGRTSPRLTPGHGDEALPEAPAVGEIRDPLLQPSAPALRRARPAGQTQGNHAFDPGADRLAEHWGRAIGRDSNYDRCAIDDRAELNVAEFRLVDDVDDRAGGVAGFDKKRGFV